MIPRNHHFVPQFVLRRFAVPGTRDKAVAVFNVDSGADVRQASIRGQAAKGSLYGADGLAEKALSELETKAAVAIDSVIRTAVAPPEGSMDHVALTVFIALQHARTPAAGKELEAAFTGLARAALKFPGVVPPELQREIDSVRVTQPYRELCGAVEAIQVAPVLNDLANMVVVNDSSVEFVCPDTGIVFHNQWAKPDRGIGVLGYACGGLQVFLPLSSRMLLCLYDPEVYRPIRDAMVARLRADKDVLRLNRLFCSGAESMVYFSGSEDTLSHLRASYRSLLRLTRAQSSRVARFASTSGSQQLITHHTEQTREPLQLPWLSVKPSMARFPVYKRGSTFRVRAKEIADLLRGPREAPNANLVGHKFARIPE